eukprot:gene3937-2801_t
METKQKKNADTYLVRRTWGALISQAVVTSLRCPSHKGSHNLLRCCSHALLLSPALTMRALLLLRGGAVAGRVAGHRSHRYRPQRVAQFRQSRSGTRRCRHGGCTAWWTGIGIRRTALWSSRRDATTRSLRREPPVARLTAAHQATGFHDSFGRRSKDAGGRRRCMYDGGQEERRTKITLCGMEILSDRLTYVRRFGGASSLFRSVVLGLFTSPFFSLPYPRFYSTPRLWCSQALRFVSIKQEASRSVRCLSLPSSSIP